MARMLLETLTAGMKLSKPVFNMNGVLLLRAEEVLTAKHLEIFKTWGIREADVLRADGTEPEALADATVSPEVRAAVEREIAHRFRRANVKADAAMATIMLVATRRLTVRLASQPAPAANLPGS
jgi:hypothetical protein